MPVKLDLSPDAPVLLLQVHKLEGLLVYKSRVSKPATSRGERDVAKLVMKDKKGVMGGIAFWAEQAHLPVLRGLRSRNDVIIVTGVQYDPDQGCSSTSK